MNKIRAVVFDAYGTLFDVYSVTARAEQLFPGKGEALALLWRERQIDYSRLRSLAAPDGARYKPFWDITIDALRYACLLYTSPSPRDGLLSRMPSSA